MGRHVHKHLKLLFPTTDLGVHFTHLSKDEIRQGEGHHNGVQLTWHDCVPSQHGHEDPVKSKDEDSNVASVMEHNL